MNNFNIIIVTLILLIIFIYTIDIFNINKEKFYYGNLNNILGKSIITNTGPPGNNGPKGNTPTIP